MELEIAYILDSKTILLDKLLDGLQNLKQDMDNSLKMYDDQLTTIVQPKFFSSSKFKGSLRRHIKELNLDPDERDLRKKESKIWNNERYCYRHSCHENVDIILSLQAEIEKLRNQSSS